jgi:hypothetical protein
MNSSDIPGANSESFTGTGPGNYTIRAGMTGTVGNNNPTSNAKTIVNIVQAQASLNYIIGKTILFSNVKSQANIDTLSISGVQESTQYFDGLGRPMQTVTTMGSPSKKDIVQPFVYDVFGLEDKKYLPYTDTITNDG